MSSIRIASEPTEYAVRIQKSTQDQARVEGQAAVKLIEESGASVPPVGPQGQGTHVNRYG